MVGLDDVNVAKLLNLLKISNLMLYLHRNKKKKTRKYIFMYMCLHIYILQVTIIHFDAEITNVIENIKQNIFIIISIFCSRCQQ